MEHFMPDFTKAEVANTAADLSAYLAFLKRLEVGQVVTLPLEQGESTRKVMRNLNAAAGSSSMRIARLPSAAGVVRFRVVAPAKRVVTMSEDARRARVEKARATRAARQAELAQVAAMGMPVEAAGTPADQVPAAEPAPEAEDPAARPAAAPRRRRRTS
jgi:hypothetical protein